MTHGAAGRPAAVTLVGGGWAPAAAREVYGPFLAAAAGDDPRIACIVLDEGDGDEQFERWRAALESAGACRPVPVLVPIGTRFDVGDLAGADAVLVCGGLTPAYAAALSPAAAELREWCAAGRPYAGFSAGAAVAASSALVGGYRVDGVIVCPGDAGEDLDEVEVVGGLGLVPVTVDVHASTWGTLGRAIAAVRSGLAATVIAIDEDTAVVLDETGRGRVVGLGAAHVVRATGDGSAIATAVRAGGVVLP